MEFTKKQRHELYIKAKEIYLTRLNMNGICYCIYHALLDLNKLYLSPENLLQIHKIGYNPKNFPELNAFASTKNFGYFWPLSDTNSRIKAFDEMIEKTKEC